MQNLHKLNTMRLKLLFLFFCILLTMKGYADEGLPDSPVEKETSFSGNQSKVYQAHAVISYHQVNVGETLEKIARQNDVSVEDLKIWNNLSLNQVSVGMELKIQKIEFIPVEELPLKEPEIQQITFDQKIVTDIMDNYIAQVEDKANVRKVHNQEMTEDLLVSLAGKNAENFRKTPKNNIFNNLSGTTDIAFNSVKNWSKSLFGKRDKEEVQPDIFLGEETYQMINTAIMEKTIKPKIFDAASDNRIVMEKVEDKKIVEDQKSVLVKNYSQNINRETHQKKNKKIWNHLSQKANVAFNSVKKWSGSLIHKQNVEEISLVEETYLAFSTLKKKKPDLVFPEPDNCKKIFHKVRIGETLTQIATRYEVSKTDIVKWNNLPCDIVNVKHRLLIFVPKDFTLAHNQVNREENVH